MPVARCDALAETLIAIEAEPLARGAVPCDGVDLGVRKEFRCTQDFGVVELPKGVIR